MLQMIPRGSKFKTIKLDKLTGHYIIKKNKVAQTIADYKD